MSLRPALTPETVAAWEAQWAAHSKSILADCDKAKVILQRLFPKWSPPNEKEMFFAGCWLGEQLDEAGCDAELSDRICFANGQMSFYAKDPWVIALYSFDEFRAGRWETPGHELAERLFLKDLPALLRDYGPPDMKALKEIEAEGIPELPPEPYPYDPR